MPPLTMEMDVETPILAAGRILVSLVADNDPGVREVARAGVLARAPRALRAKLVQATSERVEPDETPAPHAQPLVTELMPGETAAPTPGSGSGTMPSEKEVSTPGQHTTMPGE